MKKNKLTWIVILLIVILSCTGTVWALTNSSRSSSLEDIPQGMSLSEALARYSEIMDSYRIMQISEEEAQLRIQNGERVIDGNDYSAQEFLSWLSYPNDSED